MFVLILPVSEGPVSILTKMEDVKLCKTIANHLIRGRYFYQIYLKKIPTMHKFRKNSLQEYLNQLH